VNFTPLLHFLLSFGAICRLRHKSAVEWLQYYTAREKFRFSSGAVVKFAASKQRREMRWDAQFFHVVTTNRTGQLTGCRRGSAIFSFRTQKRKRHDNYQWGEPSDG
jgi:hypothetical protein